jgi:hypothetical protein
MKYVRSGQECERDGRPRAYMQQQLTRMNTPSQLVEFTLTGQISYPNKILNHLRSFAKSRCLMRIRTGPKTGIEMLTEPLVPMVLICLHLSLSEHLITSLLPESTARNSLEAINPLSKYSMEGKHLRNEKFCLERPRKCLLK